MSHDTGTTLTPTRTSPDASIESRLRAVVVRVRNYVLIEGLAWVVGFLFVAAVVQFGLDYGTRGLQREMRAALLALIVGSAGWLIWRRVIIPLRLRIGISDAAQLVERRYPDLSSLLISAVRFSAGEVGAPQANSPDLIASVIERADRRVAATDFGVVLDPRRVRWSAAGLLLVCVCVAAAVAGAPQMTGLWLARNVLLQDVSWPRRTHLIVEANDRVLIGARGDDLVVQAHADGVQPREVDVIFETASGQRGRETMVTVGSAGSYRYRHTFKNAQEDFEFHLVGGDDRTEVFEARLLDRPRVAESTMRISPPDYTRLESFTLADGQRSAQVLPGGTVAIRVTTNKPVIRAELMAARELVAEAGPLAGGYHVTFSPPTTQTYHFAFEDEAGLENREPVTFSVRVISDEPPRVRMKLPGVGDMITPEALLPIELEYADTYGLATAELIYRVTREEAADESIALPGFKAYMTTFTTSLSWPVAAAGVISGERLMLGAAAKDFDTVSGPNFAESPDLTLRVVTRDEFLDELARREQEFRMDFERLVDGQEQLRGQLLTLAGQLLDEGDAVDLATGLAPLERRQRNLASSVNVIRQQFEQILAELRVNQLDSRDVRERLEDGIVAPLTRLAKREMVAAADTLRQWARQGSAEIGSQVDPQQIALLSQMRAVLASMIQWEGYHEVVNMLRDIVRLQKGLGTETKDAIVEEAGDLFDD